MPKVSFIIPACKRRFLHEAIASILAQKTSSSDRSFRCAHSLSDSTISDCDFELVVVDDCSLEDLKSVVDEFRDERLTYHRNETNIGGKDLVAAWNHAMEYAKGEWCVLASDDDVYLPGFLSDMMALVAKYPKCDLFHARNADIDADGKWTDVAHPRVEFESQIEFAYARTVLRIPQRAPDFFFRKAALAEIGGFVWSELAWYSDDATWIRLAKNGCAHTRDVEFCFRNSGINLSSSADSTVMPKLKAGEWFRSFMHEFVSSATPANEAERILLAQLEARACAEVFDLQKVVMDHVDSFKIWLTAFRQISCSSAQKRELLYARYPRLMALRLLMPHR